MFYCYMNDEIVNINQLCYICKKKDVYVLSSSTHYTCFHLLLQLIGLRVDPQIMVYPPRNTTCHVYLYVSFLVDHDLRSTLHALF